MGSWKGREVQPPPDPGLPTTHVPRQALRQAGFWRGFPKLKCCLWVYHSPSKKEGEEEDLKYQRKMKTRRERREKRKSKREKKAWAE